MKKVSTRKQLYWNTLLRIPTQIVAFVLSIIIARILMPKDFGIMGITMMFVGYANLLTNFGFNEAVIQKSIKDRETLNSIFTFDISVSIVLASIFFFASPYIAEYFNTPECENAIKVMSSVFIISSFTALPYAILKRDMNFKLVSIFEVSQTLLMSLTTLVLALGNYGYWSLVYGQLIPLLVIAILLWVNIGWLPKTYYKHNYIKGILHFGIWNFFKSQIIFISQHVDKFIVGRWFGASSFGFYDKAMTTSEMPYNTLIMNINSVMYSSFCKLRNDKEKLQKNFKKSLTIISYVGLPIYFGMLTIAPYFVNSLLGEKWNAMIIPFQIIIVGFILKIYSGLIASLNIAIGKYKELTINLFFAFIIFTVTCFLLLEYNIIGIAIGYLIFCIVQFILWMRIALKNVEMYWGSAFMTILPCVIPSLIMFATIETIANLFLTKYSFINMLYLIIIGFIVYSIYIFFDRSKFIVELKSQVWSDFKYKLEKT